MENHLEQYLVQWSEEQRRQNSEQASRLESLACQVYRDVPTELDSPTLSRREHELMAMHREACDIAAGLAKAAGECRMAALIVSQQPPVEDFTAEELAAAEGRG